MDCDGGGGHHLIDSDGVGLQLPRRQGVAHRVQQVDNAPVRSQQEKPDLVLPFKRFRKIAHIFQFFKSGPNLE